MQYTGSSFAQPLVDLVGPLLQTRKDVVRPIGLFAKVATLWTETPDMNREYIYAPAYSRCRLRDRPITLGRLQHGRTCTCTCCM